MRDAEAVMVDLRTQVRAALLAMESELPFTVRQRWSQEPPESITIAYSEKENRSTECSVVDFISYQVDVWAGERAQVTQLAALVNRAMLELGLRRLSRGESVEQNGMRRCTMVFGRKIDKRWGRFID